MKLKALLAVLFLGIILFWAVGDLPAFGDPEAPATQYTGELYIESVLPDIGIENIVTAILASYRGFDTLGEVVVIFTGDIGRPPAQAGWATMERHHQDDIAVSVPFIQVFALVIVHGALGGRGFQGGVVLPHRSSVIIAFGLTCVRQRFAQMDRGTLGLRITIYALSGSSASSRGRHLGYGSIETALGFHTSMATSSTRSRSVSASP